MTYLDIESLQVDYRQKNKKHNVLFDVNLQLPQGEIGVIIGPSGCGKSTLLNVLANLNQDYQGRVNINGQLPIEHKGTALILQDYGLLPWKNVWNNIKLGLDIRKVSKEDSKMRNQAILNKMRIADLKKRYPAQLSGGQKQRVAIARSLVLEPELLLMDEPFSSLDALNREEMQDILLHLWQETNLTILLITHNIEEAVFLGQKIFVMSACPGTIIKTFDNDIAGDYSSRGKVEFLEMCNTLRSYLRKEN
ncbi:MAG: ABC transporter ATP-binding protein [Gracilibacter sp. BRH_c7a]|nr:MAG: ABC transporter ATP-binding protein [Gracilibacter sp. BRH_c7a]